VAYFLANANDDWFTAAISWSASFSGPVIPAGDAHLSNLIGFRTEAEGVIMGRLRTLSLVSLSVMAAFVATPTMATRPTSVSTAYFDAAGNFVGQNVWTCDNTHLVGGTTSVYTLTQTYACDGSGGDVTSVLPPGYAEADVCRYLTYWSDNCNYYPVYVWFQGIPPL
jgi:hypothetical protein